MARTSVVLSYFKELHAGVYANKALIHRSLDALRVLSVNITYANHEGSEAYSRKWILDHLIPSLVSTATLKNRSHNMFDINWLSASHESDRHISYKLTMIFDHNSHQLNVLHIPLHEDLYSNLFIMNISSQPQLVWKSRLN